jgi:hypothetical protein
MEEVKKYPHEGVQLQSLREKDQYLWGKPSSADFVPFKVCGS